MEGLENLEQAVNLFYTSQSNEQAKLNDYLTSQQRDAAAWSWLWSFLDFSKTVEVQFFGGVTLHQKLAKNWQEVPQSMRNELKEKILHKIIEFGGDGSRLVLNRLCMSVSHSTSSIYNQSNKNFILAKCFHRPHAERMAVRDL